MRNTLFRPLALVALFALPVAASAAPLKVTGKPKVSFFAEGNPGALDIEGVTNQIAVADDGATLTFTVPMDTISTGIDLRDEHMKSKFLHTDKYPTVSLSAPRTSLTFPANVNEASNGTLKLPFTAHGVTHDVDVTYEIRKTKTGWRIKGSFPFNVPDYNIEIPSYLGVTVEPAMKAEVQLEVTDAP
jgi:polyisoprenoid-binding protein YceI